ncbi:hypothetical protein JI721_11760 [Alicyclobacillus cycloheptanicus]|uniref:Uncharacterized protein n=1 Tax=Alicyclobacillus cycloheptanicus TaxID=1457 RepID=A0ABT9XGG4_9BACL|nr:hypothetical protein [Alicyclobacillus cycloheptanicus]MDQ0189215.1 hypothetical protein [Alicyclobacillus cycloheptanicus]WDM00400.1 hypothetical protein JI721_11760 [Alicyclobacillus cycloheptanicus]
MKGYLWAAVCGIVECFIGAWLIGAPWFLGIQSGGRWLTATPAFVWTGTALVVLGLIAAIAFIVAAFREQARRLRSGTAAAAEAAPAVHGADRFDGTPGAQTGSVASPARDLPGAASVSQRELVQLARQVLDELKADRHTTSG